MPALYPGRQMAILHGTAQSADNVALAKTQTIVATHWGMLLKLWVDIDVASEADLEALPDNLAITVTMGSLVFAQEVHPLVEHTDAGSVVHRTVDLGPWGWSFPGGLYSAIGDDIVFAVGAAGAGVKSRVNYLYSD